MAKATAKKRKVIVESTGEAHISATFNNIIIISLTNKKVKLFHGLQLVKWVLEVLKKHSIRSPNGSRRL
jgi:hypothetical protein